MKRVHEKTTIVTAAFSHSPQSLVLMAPIIISEILFQTLNYLLLFTDKKFRETFKS